MMAILSKSQCDASPLWWYPIRVLPALLSFCQCGNHSWFLYCIPQQSVNHPLGIREPVNETAWLLFCILQQPVNQTVILDVFLLWNIMKETITWGLSLAEIFFSNHQVIRHQSLFCSHHARQLDQSFHHSTANHRNLIDRKLLCLGEILTLVVRNLFSAI